MNYFPHLTAPIMSEVRKHIALICNPAIEKEKSILLADAIAVLLKSKNISFSLFTTYWPQVWTGITEAWIIGGDGTVNYFINQYPDLQLPLTVFAAGSGNDLHWTLYGDITMEQQVERVLQAQPRPIDAGLCNGQLFLNGVGIGFDGAIVRAVEGKKKVAGKATYLLSILKNIFTYKEKYCQLRLDHETLAQDCFMISVANGARYGGSFQVAPKASVTDALLDVMVVGKIAAGQRIRYLPVIEKGAHLQLPFVHYRHTTQVTIESAVPLHAHVDGEYCYASLFHISCLPNRFSFLL